VDLTDASIRTVALCLDLDSVIGNVDDKSVEVRRQKIPPSGVRCAAVQGVRGDQEFQEAQHAVRRVLQAIDGELEPLLDLSPLHCGLLDPRADLAHREGAGGCQLDEALFLGFELVELLLELCLRVAVLREDVGN